MIHSRLAKWFPLCSGAQHKETAAEGILSELETLAEYFAVNTPFSAAVLMSQALGLFT